MKNSYKSFSNKRIWNKFFPIRWNRRIFRTSIILSRNERSCSRNRLEYQKFPSFFVSLGDWQPRERTLPTVSSFYDCMKEEVKDTGRGQPILFYEKCAYQGGSWILLRKPLGTIDRFFVEIHAKRLCSTKSFFLHCSSMKYLNVVSENNM